MTMSVVSNTPDQGQAEIFLIGIWEAALYFVDNLYSLNDVRIDLIKEGFHDSLQGCQILQFSCNTKNSPPAMSHDMPIIDN